MSSTIFLYVTASSVKEARFIGRKIVEEKLAACVNIIPGMQSIYSWKGKIESAREVVLIIKSTQKNYARLEKRIKALHSSEVPCVVELSINRGSKEYLAWIKQES